MGKLFEPNNVISREGEAFDYNTHYDIVLCCVDLSHHIEECPFNILLIASYLESKGYKTAVMAVTSENSVNVLPIMHDLFICCDYIGFTVNECNYWQTVQCVNYLTEELEYTNIIMGGILSNYHYDYSRDIVSLDDILVCDYEGCSWIESLLSDEEMKPVDISKVRFNRNLMYRDEYIHYYVNQNVFGFGCAYNCCNMCHSTCEGLARNTFREHKMVIEECEELVKLGAKEIYGICSCMYIDKNIELFKLWNKSPILQNIRHKGSTIFLFTTSKIYDEIDGHCKSIEYGIEHGSERMLRVLNKSHKKPEQIRKHIELLSNYNTILYKFYFVIGHPKETTDDLDELLSLFKFITRTLDNKRFRLIAFEYTPYYHFKDKLIEAYNIENAEYNILVDKEEKFHGRKHKGLFLWRDNVTQEYLNKIKEIYRYCDNHNYPQGLAIRNRREFLEEEND